MLKKVIIFYFLLFFIFVIAIADSQSSFSYQVLTHLHNIPLGDKMMHFLLVGTLAAVLNLHFCWKKVNISGYKVFLGSLIALIFITLEETSQLFISHRHFELMDMFFNYAGIFSLTRLARLIQSTRLFQLIT